MRTTQKIISYLWASPTTLVGIPFVLFTLPIRGRVQLVDGVLEVQGAVVAVFLKYLARNASAMTLGHIVLGRDANALEWSRPHERIHVAQCERWGPFFLPAYAAASLLALLRRQHPYYDNAFERQAYRQAP